VGGCAGILCEITLLANVADNVVLISFAPSFILAPTHTPAQEMKGQW